MLQSLESRIHTAAFKDVQTDKGFKRAGDIGLSFSREGTLQFDDKKIHCSFK